MKITIIGAGYVGLSTGVVLAYLGHQVSFVEKDRDKISQLENRHPTFFEPELFQLMEKLSSQLTFTHQFDPTIKEADIVFITVGTPNNEKKETNLDFWEDAVSEIKRCSLKSHAVIVNKSTVPIGTCESIQGLNLVSNPEFLREGSALKDGLYPSRIVLGSNDLGAMDVLENLFLPIIDQSFSPPSFLPRPQGLKAIPLLKTNFAGAELIKYASNGFLSIKISYINEIAALAEKVGADINDVANGLGMDPRIGSDYLQSGLGWGGPCLGKDNDNLIAMAEKFDLPLATLRAAREINKKQNQLLIHKLQKELKLFEGKTIGVLGLSFKPLTDDVRDSPALDLVSQLLGLGAFVKVHDPIAMANAKNYLNGLKIGFSDSAEQVFHDAHAVILATHWPEYQNLFWDELFKKMKFPIIFDARNALDPKKIMPLGFRYLSFGRLI